MRDLTVAGHEATSADYRQNVLNAIRHVQYALQASSVIVQRQQAKNDATAAANETFSLSSRRFEAGLVNFLDGVDADRTRLEAEHRSNAVKAESLALSVQLAKAIGGGW